jgi:dienelactone hydrolase
LPRNPSPHSQEIALFHSVLGLRPGLLQWADRLRAAGHMVHAPDLYDGHVFETPAEAASKLPALGLRFDAMLKRSQAAVSALPAELVYAGFSNGGICAEFLAATRPGARAAILMHAPLLIRDLGWKAWPAAVPVEVHFAESDPLRNQPVIDALAARVRKSGSTFRQHGYPCSGHLFADPDLPAYHAPACGWMSERVLRFLAALPASPNGS